MTTWALVLVAVAVAVLAVPVPGSGRRLAELRRRPAEGALEVYDPARTSYDDVGGAETQRSHARRWSGRAWFSSARRPRWVAAAGAATAVGLLGALPLVPAVSLGVVAALLVHVGWGAAEHRVAGHTEDTVVALVGALADELRAGRSPPHALAGVAAHHAGPIAGVLGEAARTEQLGGDTEAVFRAVPRSVAGGEVIARLAAAWQLSRLSGCSLAEVLDTVAADLRAGRRRQRLLAGLLAGPRASAGLLAALPVLGLLMGAALGADPLRVLTSTGPGQLALAAGVGLDLAGILWTGRLVRGAGG